MVELPGGLIGRDSGCCSESSRSVPRRALTFSLDFEFKLFHVVVLQKTGKKCTRMLIVVKTLFCGVLVAVAVVTAKQLQSYAETDVHNKILTSLSRI